MRRAMTVTELEAAFRSGSAVTVSVAPMSEKDGVIAPFGSRVAMGGRVWVLTDAGNGCVTLEDVVTRSDRAVEPTPTAQQERDEDMTGQDQEAFEGA